MVVSGVNDVMTRCLRAARWCRRATRWPTTLRQAAGVRHVVFAPLPLIHRFPLLPQPLASAPMGADAGADGLVARWAVHRGRCLDAH